MRIADGVAVGAPEAVPLPWAVQIFAGNTPQGIAVFNDVALRRIGADFLKKLPECGQK